MLGTCVVSRGRCSSSRAVRLTATSFTPTTPPATATVGIDALVAQFREAVAVGAACAPYEDASAPLAVAARELRADALDALASRIAGARIPFPVDLEQSLADYRDDFLRSCR